MAKELNEDLLAKMDKAGVEAETTDSGNSTETYSL
jgi:hypothetical protein